MLRAACASVCRRADDVDVNRSDVAPHARRLARDKRSEQRDGWGVLLQLPGASMTIIISRLYWGTKKQTPDKPLHSEENAGECQGSEVPHTELCLFLGKTGFPNRENSEIFSQIIPRSLLGKCITTIYGIQIPENRNIVGLIPRSAYISKIYENILRFLSVYTLVYLRTNRTFPVPSERTTN